MRRVGDFQSVGVQFSIPRRLGCLTLLIEAASLHLIAIHYRNCISRLWNACASPCFTQRLIYLCRHAISTPTAQCLTLISAAVRRFRGQPHSGRRVNEMECIRWRTKRSTSCSPRRNATPACRKCTGDGKHCILSNLPLVMLLAQHRISWCLRTASQLLDYLECVCFQTFANHYRIPYAGGARRVRQWTVKNLKTNCCPRLFEMKRLTLFRQLLYFCLLSSYPS